MTESKPNTGSNINSNTGSDTDSRPRPESGSQPAPKTPWGKAPKAARQASKIEETTDDARALAAVGLKRVIEGQSLNQCLPSLESSVCERDRGFFRDLLIGSCRHFHHLNALAKMLLSRPFSSEQEVLHSLLVVGLYQLRVQQKAAHASVHATVDACEALGQSPAKSVINACLRRYQREKDALLASIADNPVTETSHPKWLVKMLTKAWPDHWHDILEQNNAMAPLCLRVNQRKVRSEDFLEQLTDSGVQATAACRSEQGVYLNQSQDVTQLPGFAEGHFSVQDEAAQLSAQLLAPQPGERVLDACSAPGGKSCHLLEKADIQLTSVELDAGRLKRVQENLDRLGLAAELICGDAAKPDDWWDGEAYDAILLDAPCSATGVIRRHPDIKLLRRRDDIEALAELQQQLLIANWRLLRPGGRLLYATCSVLPQENQDQIKAFLQHHPDAKLHTIAAEWGLDTEYGRQLFPQKGGHDGFFYALIQKLPSPADQTGSGVTSAL